MVKKISLIFSCILFSFCLNTKAQILPFSNENVEFTLINPASFGQVNGIELGLVNRSRFVNNVSNARTSLFLFNTSFNTHKNDKNNHNIENPMGLGAIILNGVSNIHQANQVTLYYSYRLPLIFQKPDKYLEYIQKSMMFKLNISFGLSVSLKYKLNQYNSLYYDENRNGIDPVLDQQGTSSLQPNVGFGMKIDSPKLTFSFSIPSILDDNNYLDLENIRLNTRFLVKMKNNINLYPILGLSLINNYGRLLKLGSQIFLREEFGLGVLNNYGSSTELSLHYNHHNKRLKVNYYFTIISNFQNLGGFILPIHEISVYYTLDR